MSKGIREGRTWRSMGRGIGLKFGWIWLGSVLGMVVPSQAKCTARVGDSLIKARYPRCNQKKLISFLYNNIVTPYSFQCAKVLETTCRQEGCAKPKNETEAARCQGRYVAVLSSCEDEIDGAAKMAMCKEAIEWSVAAIGPGRPARGAGANFAGASPTGANPAGTVMAANAPVAITAESALVSNPSVTTLATASGDADSRGATGTTANTITAAGNANSSTTSSVTASTPSRAPNSVTTLATNEAPSVTPTVDAPIGENSSVVSDPAPKMPSIQSRKSESPPKALPVNSPQSSAYTGAKNSKPDPRIKVSPIAKTFKHRQARSTAKSKLHSTSDSNSVSTVPDLPIEMVTETYFDFETGDTYARQRPVRRHKRTPGSTSNTSPARRN